MNRRVLWPLLWSVGHGDMKFDWLMDKAPEPFRSVDGRVSGVPANCCDNCGKSAARLADVPIAAAYEGKVKAPGAAADGGRVLNSEADLHEAIACAKAASADCACRVEVSITTSFHYLCEDTHNDWWRHDGNAILTGGPYPDLTVTSVVLSAILPWARQDPMLWVSLFKVEDPKPCDIEDHNARNLTHVVTGSDMQQYNYYLRPNETLTVPSAWSFVTETEEGDPGWYYLKDVTTNAFFLKDAK